MIRKQSHVLILTAPAKETASERATCIKGLFGPLWSPKLKVAFHQFLLIGL